MYKGATDGEYPTVTNCYNCGIISITSGQTTREGGIVSGNGSSSNNPAGTISNSYCTTETPYSYYYYSSGFKTSTEGRVDGELLKGYASKLGDAFVEDTNNINKGYPILVWQIEQH